MYEDKIKLGLGITVELDDGSQYSSFVQNVDEDCSVIHISPLTRMGIPVMPQEGRDVRIIASSKTCCYTFYGIINKYTAFENLKVIEIKRNTEVEKIQRRKGFRVEKSIPLDIKIYGLFDITSVEKHTTITAADISEGGIGICWSEPLEIDRFLECGIKIDDDYYLVRCRVVRCIKENGQYRIGLEIINNDEEMRQKIRKYVFREQIKK